MRAGMSSGTGCLRWTGTAVHSWTGRSACSGQGAARHSTSSTGEQGALRPQSLAMMRTVPIQHPLLGRSPTVSEQQRAAPASLTTLTLRPMLVRIKGPEALRPHRHRLRSSRPRRSATRPSRCRRRASPAPPKPPGSPDCPGWPPGAPPTPPAPQRRRSAGAWLG